MAAKHCFAAIKYYFYRRKTMEKDDNVDKNISDIKEKIMYASPLEACRLMDSDMRGLSGEEAARRLEKYGRNAPEYVGQYIKEMKSAMN